MSPNPRRTTSLHVLAADEGVAIGQVGAVCVVIWRKAVVQARVHMMASGLAQVIEGVDAGAGLLSVIEPSFEPSDESLRRQLVAAVARHGSKVKCTAIAIEARGFRAAVIRSLISGIALLDRRTNVSPYAACPDVRAAARWMNAYVPLSHDIPAAVEELRLQFTL